MEHTDAKPTRRIPHRDLRTATMAVLLLAFVLIAVMQWLSARWLYDEGFGKAERSDELSMARHAQAIVGYPLEYLKRTDIDNAMWDDAYEFQRGRNPRFPASLEIMSDSFRMLHMSAFVYVQDDRTLHYARQFNASGEHLVAADPALMRGVAEGITPLLQPGIEGAGFARIAGQVYGWTSAPVLHTDGTGPPLGWWVMLTAFNGEFLSSISRSLGERVWLETRPGLPANVHTPLLPDEISYRDVDEQTADVRFDLGPLGRGQTVVLAVRSPRAVQAVAARASQTLLFSTLAIGVVLTGLALLFVNRRIFQPLRQASRTLARIGRTGDLATRLKNPTHHDEIGQLVDSTNDMLSQLQRRSDLEDAMIRALPDVLLRVDRQGIVIGAHLPEDGRRGHSDTLAAAPPVGRAIESVSQVLADAVLRARHTGAIQQFEYTETRSNGRLRFLEARVAIIDDDEALVLLRDITERKEAERRVARLAYYDTLTDLPNRTAFMDRLGREVRRARHDGARFALLFLDLDGFKEINDTLGHSIGDRILLWTAEHLREALRPADAVAQVHPDPTDSPAPLARLGGDEFTMLVTGIRNPEDVLAITHRIAAAVRRPIVIEERELSLSASIGVAVYPDDGEDAETLLKNADTALYHAKKQGRDSSQLYSASLTEQAMRRLDLDNSMRTALARGEFHLVYQPVIELATGRMVSVEALIRWNHPERGMISPALFIPLAEENGLIAAIGDWVLRTACAELASWRGQGFDLRVAVNVSPRQFHRPDFVASVMDTLGRAGLSPSALELEFTEGAAMERYAVTRTALEALRARGVRIALDDFGTGYSSLSYLMQLPIDTIKIDRSFVGRLPADSRSASIVRAVMAIAGSMGVDVTAEGAESREQVQALAAMRCRNVQGYFFSRPVPAGEILALAAMDWTVGMAQRAPVL